MKSILITGASRGIGRSIALKCAQSGDFNRIIINCRNNLLLLQDAAQRIKDTNPNIECFTSLGDVGDIEYVKTLKKEIGSVDVIVNNAAISYTGLIIDMTPEEWNTTITTNLTSVYNTCHVFLPDMISKRSGHIINLSSVWGKVGASCEVAYSATKGAIDAFTKSLAKEMGPSKVQVNALALGIVDTDMNNHLNSAEKSEIVDDIPMGRMLTPDEVGSAVLNLLNMPPYFTGEIVKLDGGWI